MTRLAWLAGLAAGAGLVLVFVALAWGRGFLHHALRQARGDKASPQPARGYWDAVTSELSATASLLVDRLRTLAGRHPWDQGAPDEGPPVVLVPDPALGPASTRRLAALLASKGFTNLHVVTADASTVEELGRHVDAVLEASTEAAGGLAVGIGHGAGGLALRWAAEHGETTRMVHLVTVGTPHAGTRSPPWRGLDRAELAPGSGAIEGLEEAPWTPCTSVFSHLDDRVVPARSGRWGDRAVAVPGVGHRGLVYEPRATRVILAAVVAALAEAG